MQKRLLVSQIEAGMPARRLDPLLREIAGKRMEYEWEVNDCGEQTGTAAHRGRDFPMCVEARAVGFDVAVTMAVGVGTFKKGIAGSPVLRGLRIDQEGEPAIELTRISELRPKLFAITGRK